MTVPLVKIRVTEALDDKAAVRLGEALSDAVSLRPRVLVLDLAGCSFLSTAGLQVLLRARRVSDMWVGVWSLSSRRCDWSPWVVGPTGVPCWDQRGEPHCSRQCPR